MSSKPKQERCPYCQQLLKPGAANTAKPPDGSWVHGECPQDAWTRAVQKERVTTPHQKHGRSRNPFRREG
jgi:hypothetical protein